ncbi:MAG: hypothetical protein QF578_18680, partial [Alphaproteobacteria bacterium]|nr:hypothetical protein [Alphaproteobacteria bacterium]
PVPNDLNPQLVDRKAAMAAAAELETPAAAAARQARGEAAPAKYAPRPPDPDGPKGVHVKPSVYGGGTDGAGAAKG